MKIFGIAVGTDIIGFAVFDTAESRLLSHVARPLRGGTAIERMDALPDALKHLLPGGSEPDAVAIGPMSLSTQEDAAVLAVAGYMVRRRIRRLHVAVLEFTAAQTKSAATGRANASICEVRPALEERFDVVFASDAAADAAAVALAAADEFIARAGQAQAEL